MIPRPDELAVANLPHKALAERKTLPKEAAVYFVLGEGDVVLYIGKAISLWARWKNHHRTEQVEHLPNVRIAWLLVEDVTLLDEIEAALIAHFTPPLNTKGRPRGLISARPRTTICRRTCSLLVLLSPDERQSLEELADEWGMSLAGSLRRLLRERRR